MEPSKVKVTVISTEMIKPASPTPSHLRKFTLSLLDQKYSPMIVPAVLFYKRPQGAASLDISRFKTCLSQTLTAFYPLAGRVESESTILCNDEGIPFVEACVDCELSSVVESLSSKNADYLRCFYPPREGLIDAGIHFAFQVSVFSCGGFGFALYGTHKITDATSSSFFFRYWAALVAQRSEYAAEYLADFNSAVRVFPPAQPQEEIPVTPPVLLEEIPVTPPIVPQEEIPVTSVLNHEKQGEKQEKEEKKDSSSSSSRFVFQSHIVARSFVIKNEAVAELKARSISEEVPNPSRFEAIAGFLWKSILSSNSAMEGRSMLNVAVDLRSRVDPPLPADSIGNIFETALVKSEKNADLPELVAKIRKSISKIKDLATEYQGEKREEAKDAHWKEFINSVIECKGKDAYVITPWYKSAGFAELDFGFGNPKRIVPIDDVANHNQRNTIILSDFLDPNGNGFEAWMFLEEECIKFLESSKEFLAMASPNF